MYCCKLVLLLLLTVLLLQVFIVDFGFASHVPSKERAALDRTYCQVAFAGTPDYASRDALRGVRCSPKVRCNCPKL